MYKNRRMVDIHSRNNYKSRGQNANSLGIVMNLTRSTHRTIRYNIISNFSSRLSVRLRAYYCEQHWPVSQVYPVDPPQLPSDETLAVAIPQRANTRIVNNFMIL
jgi:hypothetical protein